MAAPTAQEQAAARAPHHPPTAPQIQHRSSASSRHELLASVNRGKPEIAATAKVNDFSGRGVVRARDAGAAGAAGVIHEASAPVHAGDSPRPTPPAQSDSENQRQQTQLQARHERERQALQQQQTQDHDRSTQRSDVGPQARDKLEQQHQQQTQQLQQRHADEQQRLQESQQRHPAPKENPKENPRENRSPPQP